MKDAIVIGAGWAGVIAARQLKEAGLDVQVLEAQDRVGGRVKWGRIDPEIDLEIEWGGTYVPPMERQTPLMGIEMKRYGFDTVMTNSPQVQYWWLNKEFIESKLPVPFDKIPAFEKLLYCMSRDAHRLSTDHFPGEEAADLDVTAAEWMARNEIDTHVKEWWFATSALYMGARPDEVSMLHILWWIAEQDHSLWKMETTPIARINRGAATLVKAIVDDAGIDIRFESPVKSVVQHDDHVVVTLVSGETFVAKRIVVATPSNLWRDIEFSPALTAPKQKFTTDGHAGIATKWFALLRNAPDFSGIGWGVATQWIKTEYTIPEGRIVIGFGIDGFDGGDDEDAFRAAIHTYVPEAEIVKVWRHDWVKDPYAQSGWCAYRAGQMTELGEAMRDPEGRLYFATADIARVYNGWMEGGIETGLEASAALIEDLKNES